MIHKAIQFLSINSEIIRKNTFECEICFIYLLFSYSKKFSKEYYNDYAFEILEEVFRNQLFKCNMNTVAMGYIFNHFIDDSFFESDEQEEIMRIVDEVAFKKVEEYSRTEFQSNYFEHLVLLGFYLKNRITFREQEDTYFLELKEYLLITFSELTLNISEINEEKDFNNMINCKKLFQDSQSIVFSREIAQQGIKDINTNLLLSIKKIENDYLLHENPNNTLSLQYYNLIFSTSVGVYSLQKKKIKKENEVIIESTIHELKQTNLYSEKMIHKLLLSSLFLINDEATRCSVNNYMQLFINKLL